MAQSAPELPKRRNLTTADAKYLISNVVPAKPMTVTNNAHRAPPVPEMQAAILERKLTELEGRMGALLERIDPEVRQGATLTDAQRPRLPPEPPPSPAMVACESGAAAAGPQLMLQVES